MKKNVFVTVILVVVLTMIMTSTLCYADGIADSQLGQGVSNMLNDITTWLVIICPIAGGLAAVYFFIRRSMTDEQDGKLWEKRIKTAIVCGVGGALVAGVIKLLSSYFGS